MKMKIKDSYIRYMLVLGVILVLVIVGYLVKNVFTSFSEGKNQTTNKNESLEVIYDVKEDKSIQKKEPTVTLENNKGSDIKVEIKGAVEKPGVYTVYEEDRVEDLVKLAGGFLPNADRLRIRLADRLIDEGIIYVYLTGERANTQLLEIGINNNLTIDKTNSSHNSKDGKNSKDSKININTATKEQLMTLTGIGEIKANSIISYREEHNGFKAIDELKNVSGIGEKTLAKFVQLVDINW